MYKVLIGGRPVDTGRQGALPPLLNLSGNRIQLLSSTCFFSIECRFMMSKTIFYFPERAFSNFLEGVCSTKIFSEQAPQPPFLNSMPIRHDLLLPIQADI